MTTVPAHDESTPATAHRFAQPRPILTKGEHWWVLAGEDGARAAHALATHPDEQGRNALSLILGRDLGPDVRRYVDQGVAELRAPLGDGLAQDIADEERRLEVREQAQANRRAAREEFLRSSEGLDAAADEFEAGVCRDLTTLPQPEWLIDGWLMAGSVARVVAKSGTGKSFVQLSKLAAVATGTPWYGQRTRQTNVLAVLAEGQAGTAAREDAFLKHFRHTLGLAPGERLPIHWVPRAVDLSDPGTARRLKAYILRHKIGYVSIDTQSRSFVGVNENDATEMGVVFDTIATLVQETGATIELVHHTGKGDPRDGEMITGRGSGVIRDGAENEMLLKRESKNTAEDRITITGGKSRDGKDGDELVLYPLEVALDEPRGDMKHSLVLVTIGERLKMPDAPAALVAQESAERPAQWRATYTEYVRALDAAPEGLTRANLARAVGKERNGIQDSVNRMRERGFIAEDEQRTLRATDLGRQGVRFEDARGGTERTPEPVQEELE
ncbi:AAA family ATPase [Streptomyces tendae]|uniref:AAA family ATPase n=1 Tax=Streptomyces tendae TaxID=1932 RepID=UPI0036C1AE6D